MHWRAHLAVSQLPFGNKYAKMPIYRSKQLLYINIYHCWKPNRDTAANLCDKTSINVIEVGNTQLNLPLLPYPITEFSVFLPIISSNFLFFPNTSSLRFLLSLLTSATTYTIYLAPRSTTSHKVFCTASAHPRRLYSPLPSQYQSPQCWSAYALGWLPL